MSDINYVIDNENKVITGTLTVNMKELVVQKMSDFGVVCRDFAQNVLDDEVCTITAKAVCKDGDIFDEKFGKGLVEAKIHGIKHEKIFDRLAKLNFALDGVGRGVTRLGLKHWKKKQSIHRDLKEYYGLDRKVESI